MGETRLMIMKLHFWTLVVATACAPAWSAPATSGDIVSQNQFQSPLPIGCKATLHFARSKVAAGAIKDDAHQSEFWIEVRDAQGKPKRGIAVDLPLISKGGQGKGTEKGDGIGDDNSIVARLEWLPATLRVKSASPILNSPALTGADGRARGQFTSGNRTEEVEFSVVGNAKGSISQVWNEMETPFNDTYFVIGKPVEVRFTMRFLDGKKWVPITGHHLTLAPKNVSLGIEKPERQPDEDQGADDSVDYITFSEEEPEETGWKAWLKWSHYGTMTEVEPGIYVGYYQGNVPEGAVINGKRVITADDAGYSVLDFDAYE